MSVQSESVARIVLEMDIDTNGAITTANLLRALNRAFGEGFEAGSAAANQNHLRMQEMIQRIQEKVL